MKPVPIEEFELMVELVVATHSDEEIRAVFNKAMMPKIDNHEELLNACVFWSAWRKTRHMIREDWLNEPYNSYLRRQNETTNP